MDFCPMAELFYEVCHLKVRLHEAKLKSIGFQFTTSQEKGINQSK
jgi:hypothetical protein